MVHAQMWSNYLLMNEILEIDSNVIDIKDQGMFFNIWQVIVYPFMVIIQLVNRLTAASGPEVRIECEERSQLELRMECDNKSQLELKSCKFELFKYLVAEQKCQVQRNDEDKDVRTPFHYACASGQLSIAHYLHREKLSDLVHTTFSGDTPLHIACKYSQVEITEFLVSANMGM